MIRLEEMEMGKRLEENNEKNENNQKEEYLWGYRRHGRRIKRIEAEIEEIRNMKMYPSMNNDGMPKGSNQSDLSGFVAELQEKEDMLYQEGVEAVKVYKDIENQIKKLEDQDERDVLFYRYIKGYDFWKVAEMIDKSERTVYRIHRDALRKMKKI